MKPGVLKEIWRQRSRHLNTSTSLINAGSCSSMENSLEWAQTTIDPKSSCQRISVKDSSITLEESSQKSQRSLDLQEKSFRLLCGSSRQSEGGASEYFENLCSSNKFLDDSLNGVLQRCMTARTRTTDSARSRSSTSAEEKFLAAEDLCDEEFHKKHSPPKSPSSNLKVSSTRLLRNLRIASASGRFLHSARRAEDLEDDVIEFAPDKFRYIPGFVFLARRVDLDMFHKFIYFFFEKKRWPKFSEISPQFQRICKILGVSSKRSKDMPAFAPEWVFHLQKMNNSIFWSVIRYFFNNNKFSSWDLLPPSYVSWFKKLQLGEFEYPSITKFQKLPDNVKVRYKFFLERRLLMTQKRFSKGKKSCLM